MNCPKGYIMSPNGVCEQSNYKLGGPVRKQQQNLMQPCIDNCNSILNTAGDCYGLHDYPVMGSNCACVPLTFGGNFGSGELVEVDYDDDGIMDGLEWQQGQWNPQNIMYHCVYSGPSFQQCVNSCLGYPGGGSGMRDPGDGVAEGPPGGYRQGGRIRRRRGRRR